MSARDFEVDTGRLAALVTRMTRCEETLQALTDDVERTVATLQETWIGEAAQAQRLAHAEWEKGLAAMRAAIEDLRVKAAAAHENYEAAVAANVDMWRSVR